MSAWRSQLCWQCLLVLALAFAVLPRQALAQHDLCDPLRDEHSARAPCWCAGHLNEGLAVPPITDLTARGQQSLRSSGSYQAAPFLRRSLPNNKDILASARDECGRAGTVHTLDVLRATTDLPPPSTAVPPLATVRAALGELLEPATSPWLANSWKTTEYSRSATIGGVAGSSRLDLINAAEGYARRVTGKPGGGGITVALLDTGVNAAHSQLDLANEFDYGRADLDPHGTFIAGIVAARRDDTGMHGVAYNANLVSIGRHPDEAPLNASAADIASATGLTRTYGTYESTPEASSHILNMSWGEPGRVPVIKSAMVEAARAGRIMVAALGNEGETRPVAAPAIHVADAGIAGFAITVGALNEAGTGAASGTNYCGPVARYCLFAPGTRVMSTDAATLGYNVRSGTSFSAAFVSGAAAVVWAAFPNKRGDQIVGRLLSTATPVDSAEISGTYGHGALDLGAAMNPVGFLSLLNSAAPLRSSFIDLPPGFAAPPANAVLASAVAYDQQMFPFLVDLNAVFRTTQRLPAGLVGPAFGHPAGELPAAWVAGRAVHARRTTSWPDWQGRGSYRMEFRPAPSLAVAVSKGFGAVDATNRFIGQQPERNPLGDRFSANPFAALAGWGESLSFSWRAWRQTAVDFTGKRGEGYFGATRTWFAAAGLGHRLGTVNVGLRYGLLFESGSWLGARTHPAVGSLRDGRTTFLNLRVEGRPSERLTLFGSLTEGTTRGGPGQPGSLIARRSKARAKSFLLGGEVEHLWLASDRLTVTAAMPFRVQQAKLHLDIPDRELADGVVHYTRQVVDLRPRGREIELQLAYAVDARNERLSLEFGTSLSTQPNHAASADPEWAAVFNMRVIF